eukprot:15443708-Alexandrium_andersonii.AAC.1
MGMYEGGAACWGLSALFSEAENVCLPMGMYEGGAAHWGLPPLAGETEMGGARRPCSVKPNMCVCLCGFARAKPHTGACRPWPARPKW